MTNKLFFILLFFSIYIFSQDNQRVKLEPVSFTDNSYNDFAPTMYKNGILFVSDRAGKFYSLYYSDLKSSPKKIKLKGQKYHIGQTFYDKNTNTAYITKTSNEKSTKSNTFNLAVYSAKIDKNKIRKLKKLHFCNPDYNYGHAQILDNKLIVITNENNVFSLISFENNNGKWINKKVLFKDKYPILNPTFMDKSTIVFASKRPGGLGGIDLYKINKKGNQWSKPINLKIFNSKFDDLSLLFTNKNEGYISSNRLDNKDHIFKFKITKKN